MSMKSIFMVFFVAIVLGALAVLFLGKETKSTDPDQDNDVGLVQPS